MTRTSRFIAATLSILVIAGSLVAFTQRQQLLDSLALRNYTPSSRVVALADETTMRDPIRRVFYVNHPEINSKEDFRNKCPSTEQSIVLGCYVQHSGIYLLDVQDPRLDGVVQVTAAHEALHAEYDRLSKDERARVDQMTNTYFASLTNERIKKTVEQYRVKDPSVVPNELHSILGTEARNLSPELEQYYSQYFKDRSQIVAFSEKYEQTFVNLTNQVDAYDQQLKSLRQTIDSNKVEIEGQSKDIELQKSRLDSLLSSDRTEAYNDAVPNYNATVGRYNSLINDTRQLIGEYNDIVEKRNNIATTEQELVDAINSNELPKESQ